MRRVVQLALNLRQELNMINFRKQLAMGSSLPAANKTQMGGSVPSSMSGQASPSPTRTPTAKRYPKVAANAMNPSINASPEPV